MTSRRTVETPSYIEFARRVIRAAGRRVANADEVELRMLLGLHSDLDNAVAEAVNGLRQRGVSWAYIASAFGITRQAAQQRWGEKVSA